MKINSFRDLRVWQGGMDLVERIYRLTAQFPREETYSLVNQLQRAAQEGIGVESSPRPPTPDS